MKNFPGKEFSNLIYWLSCKYSIGPSGIATWLATFSMCAFGFSALLALFVISSSPKLFVAQMTIMFFFFVRLTILSFALQYTSEKDNVFMVKIILFVTGLTLITSSLFPIHADHDPILVLMFILGLFTDAIRKVFSETEKRDQKTLQKGHVPEMRSNDLILFLSSISFCFILVTAIGCWIKYDNSYPMIYAWTTVCFGFISLFASSAAYACIPRPPTHVKKNNISSFESPELSF